MAVLVSSTTGLRSGNLLNELARQKAVALKAVRRAQEQRKRAEMWKQRALAAEAALSGNRWKLQPWEQRKKAA